MGIVFDAAQLKHRPSQFLLRGRFAPCPEVPERAERLLAAALADGHRLARPEPCGPGPREAVHDAGYLEFLATAHAQWSALPGAAPEIVPNVHANRNMSRRPDSIVGLAGYYMADAACPIGPETFAAAVASADAAVTATRAVLNGARVAYALCRPPGHHAYADMAGGFCYLNNVAIAAEEARRRHPRLAILDIDVHHGNGTQGIFYTRSDVLFVSIHADPASYYPFFSGYAGERGSGAGEGYTLNLPLAHGSGDTEFLDALDRALDRIRDHDPPSILVSLGLDAAADDPLGALRVTTAGFAAAATAIARLARPTVLIQEGGYLSDSLGANLAAFLMAFEAAA